MKTIRFPISHKENESRRAIVPEHIKLLDSPVNLYIETGYGKVLGISDDEYAVLGCHVTDRSKVLESDVIVDPKCGDADYLDKLNKGQTILGWGHATQNRDITDKIIKSRLTAYAWEKMFYKGRHIFWRNN